MNQHRSVESKNQSRHLEVGRMGEEIAREFLERKGYKIIERNYRTKYAEIDLVARYGGDLIFVEVRTKRGEDFGMPEETINKKKMKKLWKNAMAYVAMRKWKSSFRIDAVCIVLKPNYDVERLGHYEGIV